MTDEQVQEQASSQEKTSDNKPARAANGQLLPGNTANPNGRPRGSGISITTEIKRKLEEVPEGQKKTYLAYLIDHIIKKAIQDGDDKMIDRIWAYVDGQPRQNIQMGVDDTVEEVEVKIVHSRDEAQA